MTAATAPHSTPMQTRQYTVRFLTPAFLGNAEQNGQWRTPPFKHLLREWWRVAWAAQNDPADWPRMREIEGRLFGHAWLDPAKGEDTVKARRSRVLVRLSRWDKGKLQSMPRTRPAGPGKNPIAADEQAVLRLAFPLVGEVEGVEYLSEIIALMHTFGTLGGRSRNGWGSFELETRDSAPPPVLGDISPFLRDWTKCLEERWAHAIGSDGQPLVWATPSRDEWKTVIEDLAQIRKQVNGCARSRRDRLILNQPVGGKGERMPSNLRFKVRRDGNGRLYGMIFHMPCRPYWAEQRDLQPIKRVWSEVHRSLDRMQGVERVEEGI